MSFFCTRHHRCCKSVSSLSNELLELFTDIMEIWIAPHAVLGPKLNRNSGYIILLTLRPLLSIHHFSDLDRSHSAIQKDVWFLEKLHAGVIAIMSARVNLSFKQKFFIWQIIFIFGLSPYSLLWFPVIFNGTSNQKILREMV